MYNVPSGNFPNMFGRSRRLHGQGIRTRRSTCYILAATILIVFLSTEFLSYVPTTDKVSTQRVLTGSVNVQKLCNGTTELMPGAQINKILAQFFDPVVSFILSGLDAFQGVVASSIDSTVPKSFRQFKKMDANVSQWSNITSLNSASMQIRRTIYVRVIALMLALGCATLCVIHCVYFCRAPAQLDGFVQLVSSDGVLPSEMLLPDMPAPPQVPTRELQRNKDEPGEAAGPHTSLCRQYMLYDLLFLAYYLTYNAFLYALVNFALAHGMISYKFGLSWALWCTWLTWVLTLNIVLALVRHVYWNPSESVPPWSVIKMAQAAVPVIGGDHDLASDYVFAGICFYSAQCASGNLHALGIQLGLISLLTIWFPPVLLFARGRTRAELRDMHWGVLEAETKPGSFLIQQASAFCTEAKLIDALLENFVQSCLKAVFAWNFQFTPFVIFSVGMSSAKVFMIPISRWFLIPTMMESTDITFEDLKNYLDVVGVNARVFSNRQSALHLSLQGGWSFPPEKLLTARADPAQANRDGETPLHMVKDARLAGLLIEARADVHVSQGGWGFWGASEASPLIRHAQEGREPIVQVLAEARADVNVKDGRGNSPMHFAVTGAVIDCLLSFRADLEHQNQEGETPLHVVRSHQCAQSLLMAGAQVRAQSHKKYTPLHLSAQKGREDVVKALVGGRANLMDVASNTDTFGVESGSDSTATFKWTPLRLGILSGNAEVVSLLLSAKADSNQEDPLMTGARAYHHGIIHETRDAGKIMASLVESRASCDTSKDLFPLVTTAALIESSHTSVAKELISFEGAAIAIGTGGKTALHAFAERPDSRAETGMMYALLLAKAQVNRVDDERNSPLHNVMTEDAETIKLLIDWHADVNALNSRLESPIHSAIVHKNVVALAMLLRSKADANASVKAPLFAIVEVSDAPRKIGRGLLEGVTLADWEQPTKHVLVRKLLLAGSQARVQETLGPTCPSDAIILGQHETSNAGNPSFVQMLIDAKADIDISNRRGCALLITHRNAKFADCFVPREGTWLRAVNGATSVTSSGEEVYKEGDHGFVSRVSQTDMEINWSRSALSSTFRFGDDPWRKFFEIDDDYETGVTAPAAS